MHPHAAHTGGTAPAYLVSAGPAPARVRAEADLRVTGASGASGLVLGYSGAGDHLAVWLDRDRGALVTAVRVQGVDRGTRVTPLPPGFRWDTWHHAAAELRGTRLTVEVGTDRLRDAVAVQERDVPVAAVHGGRVGAAARGPGASPNRGPARRCPPTATSSTATRCPPTGAGCAARRPAPPPPAAS
ncbi:hypothetical protein ACGFZL_16655 [Streptomyces sp. NPDC048182]|uniref:hypothetical protein n=1 Tax=Streptomyces sp. NPDC048182 TaxID=3365507 RepID=UPI003717DF14